MDPAPDLPDKCYPPTKSAAELSLSEPSIGSGFSGHNHWEEKREKRLEQWQRLQRKADTATIGDRARQQPLQKRQRIAARKSNNWAAKKSRNFRWVNNRERPPSPSDSGSLRSFTEGTFLHWNREHDPGFTPEHR